MKINSEKIKIFLERNYKEYKKLYSSNDPVWHLHTLKDVKDIEISAFILSCFAYGRVGIMNEFTSNIFNRISGSIFEFTINFERKDEKYFRNFYYRFNSGEDIILLFKQLKKAYREFSTLKDLFINNYSNEDDNVLKGLNYFTDYLKKGVPYNLRYHYLVPDSRKNSTCKRLNLFLRWMVRKDDVDLGIWGKEVNKSKLIIPVDTHVYRISRKLGLIDRKSCDMKFALVLTDKLKEFDPADPVKYDFALCHIGMENKKPQLI